MPESPSHLHFVQSTEPLQGGGLGRAAVELHHAFLDAGSSSRLVATRGRGTEPIEGRHVQLFDRSGPERAFYSPALRREAANLAGEAGAVHGHGFYVSTNWILGGEARRQGVPLVYHPHGMFEPWILARSRLKKRIAHYFFENANFRHARLWRALTNTEAGQIRAQGVRTPIVIAPNGIHPEPFNAFAGLPKQPEILFLGRLHPKKGIDLLIRAFASHAQRFKDWRLILAGPDELGHRAELEALTEKLGMRERVDFPGTLSGDDKYHALARAGIFALTSYSEGFSVALLEGMAARCPVLATTACNFPEIADHGAGWLCEPTAESVGKLLGAALAEDGAARRQRGDAARGLVDKSYTWEAIARTILDACDEHCT